MKVYDVEDERRILCSEVGYSFFLDRSFQNSEKANGLASSAHAYINEAINCILVGFTEPAEKLLNRAQEWLQAAIAKNERPQRYFKHADEAARFYDMALLAWLTKNKHEEALLTEFTNEWDLYLLNSDKWDTVEISLILPKYYDSGRYARLIDIFDRTPRLKAPLKLNEIKTEGVMAYVMSMHKLGQSDFSENAVNNAIKLFLNRNVNKWLTNGHFDIVARWMKLVYWKDGLAGLSSREALLKCFDHTQRDERGRPRRTGRGRP